MDGGRWLKAPLGRHSETGLESQGVAKVVGNLWTSVQRQSNPIHEISYRACFKAELPHFFISRYTSTGDSVYDPFTGRGTTPVEAAIMGRIPFGADINPLSSVFAATRLDIPGKEDIAARLSAIDFKSKVEKDLDLSMFFHPDTYGEILSLRDYLGDQKKTGAEDSVDRFIRMVATNRLTGHSKGFFSVYTLPPNQAASISSQIRINSRRNQVPPYRDVRELIWRKASSLLREMTPELRGRINRCGSRGGISIRDARDTSQFIPGGSIDLTVTSPPFLNIVQYSNDNWMRSWFNRFDGNGAQPYVTGSLESWNRFILDVFRDLYRITRSGGRVAFEVGEVRKGKLALEGSVAKAGKEAGFTVEKLFINRQKFTKTSNIWGVKNNLDGTNSNRIVLFRKGN